MDIKSKSENYFGVFIILIIIVVGDLQLFKLGIFSRQIILFSPVIALAIIGLFIVLKYVYRHEKEFPKNFSLPIKLILLSALLSPIIAFLYRDQPYILSIWISIGIFFYLLYFLLHIVKIDPKTLQKIIISIGIIAMALYYIQYLIFPARIFSDEVTIVSDRSTLRIWVPGLAFTIVAYFYYLDRFFKDNNLGDIVIALFAYATVILQASRPRIAVIALLTIIMLLRSKRVSSRLLIIVLSVGGLVALFFSFYDIFLEMYLVSKNQASAVDQNIRIIAARYFLTDFMVNDLAYIFGNASGHQRSPYGMTILMLQRYYGFYLSDIGIIGDYVKFGALFLLGVIIMIFKFIRIKVDPESEYLKYYIYLIILTMFTGTGNFGSPNILIILIAYLLDVSNYNLKYQLNTG